MSDKEPKEAINTYSHNKIPSGMLSSPHIKYCIKKHGIVENYDLSCVDSATYHMRIGDKVLTWEKGEKVEYILGDHEDKSKNIRTKVELKPNSLTFVTTIEKFNLPKDIIARFNLKSKWVHLGLLLGTGPIVDPELYANLLIPLHNFSSQPVEIGYGKKLISVEFTKTLNPDDTFEIDGETIGYVKNKSRIFNFDAYRKRIAEKRVESSVSSKFDQYDKSVDDYQVTLEKVKEENRKSLLRFNWVGGLTAAATWVGLVVLIVTTWMLVSSAFEQSTDASNIIKQYKDQNIDFRAFALKSNYEELNEQLLKIQKQTNNLKADFLIRPRGDSSILEGSIRKYEEKYEAMGKRIDELDKRIDRLVSVLELKNNETH
jgi:deoxycytidine triphosphate deaminase